MQHKFQIGDLVQFDFAHSLGIVIDIKKSEYFDHIEYVSDILVCWSNGEVFWCLDCTIQHVTSDSN